jgi:hypothetical protein
MNNDFSSIERLMEFGMSIAVAQQMVATMNHAVGNMAVPGAGAPIQQSVEYYVVVDGAQAGPLSEEEFRLLIERGAVTGESLIWHRGLTAWKQAKNVPEANKWILLSNSAK